MKKKLLAIAVSSMLLPALLEAQVVVRDLGHWIPDLESEVAPPEIPEKIDGRADFFVIPYFEVDTTNPAGGTTTLIAVRNSDDEERTVSMQYRNPDGTEMLTDEITLAPKRIRTFNLRDLGLPAEMDGFSRGYARVIDSEAIVNVFPQEILTVDYFLVDDENNFATGERAINLTSADGYFDLCQSFEARFANAGAFDGTRVVFYASAPQGDDPATDSPTVLVNAFDEAGNAAMSTVAIYSANVSFVLDATQLSGTFDFGALEIVFNNTVGHVGTITQALERFSVGFNGACTTRPDP